MKCHKCQTENPAGKKFCRSCGAKLVQACPQCGAQISPGDSFCGDCQKLEEVGNPQQLWLTRTDLARLYEKMNRPDLERQQWNAAAAIARSTADGLKDETLRKTFIEAGPIREILEHANQ